MLFGSKKQKQPELDVGQKFFKFAAFCFLLFVLYQMYSSDFRGRINEGVENKQLGEVTQGQLNQKGQEKFDKMYQEPEYQKIKEFVNYIDNNFDKKKGAALKAPAGYLIFIPFDLVFKDNSVPDNKILVHSDEVEFYIDYKIVQKILENPSVQDKAQAVNSDIGEIKSDLDSAEYNRLMKEISEKNGVKYNSSEKEGSDVIKPELVKKPEKDTSLIKIQNKPEQKSPFSDAVKQQGSKPSDKAVQAK